jgi:uncharacterized membrane protein
MKFNFVFYGILAICFQIVIGKLTGFGQGSIGLLLFVTLVELDSRFSFRYIKKNIDFIRINSKKE